MRRSREGWIDPLGFHLIGHPREYGEMFFDGSQRFHIYIPFDASREKRRVRAGAGNPVLENLRFHLQNGGKKSDVLFLEFCRNKRHGVRWTNVNQEPSVAIVHISTDRILRQRANTILLRLLVEFDVEEKLELVQPEHENGKHEKDNDRE
jgi:hypothetical protein